MARLSAKGGSRESVFGRCTVPVRACPSLAAIHNLERSAHCRVIVELKITPSGVLGLGKSTPRTGEISKLLARLEQWLVQYRAHYHHTLHAGANRGEVNALK
jgi:hypothetical protein